MGHDGPPGRAGRNIHTYPFGFMKIRKSMKIRSSISTPNGWIPLIFVKCKGSMGHDGPPGRAGRNIHTYPFGFTEIRESMKIRSSTSTPNCSDAVFTITCISLRFNDCWTTMCHSVCLYVVGVVCWCCVRCCLTPIHCGCCCLLACCVLIPALQFLLCSVGCCIFVVAARSVSIAVPGPHSVCMFRFCLRRGLEC